jgi:DNA (cytosine-5)-methyltransferase 1
VENEPYCQAVLRHHWPEVPVLGDIKNVQRSNLPDPNPDVIVGGFPCQPFSHAGKQRARDDPRHLWPEMFRLIRECRPTWVIGENVAGLVRLGLDEVLSDLEGEGYATRTFNIPACAVGAPHIRQRLWIVAHSDSQGEPDKPLDGGEGSRQLGFGDVADAADDRARRRQQQSQSGKGTGDVADSSIGRLQKHGHSKSEDVVQRSETVADTTSVGRGIPQHQVDTVKHGPAIISSGADVADAKGQRMERGWATGKQEPSVSAGQALSGCDSTGRREDYWEVEPAVGRVVDGLPNRVPQLRALGNSIIPQIAQEIGEAIKTAEGYENG